MSKRVLGIILCIGLIISGTTIIKVASAQDETLAAQYAPILYFELNEKCYPVDLTYALNNSYLFEVGNPLPISTTPTKQQLANYTTDNYYLDNQRGTVAAGDDGIENDYHAKASQLGYKVYVHVDPTGSAIQYWFFYAFNEGTLNRHEGDWEMVQVALNNGQPTQVMYSQHHGGQVATWSQVDKTGDHVKVYVARGSHANYIKSYSGKIGLASDDVGDNGKVLQPSQYTLEVLDAQPWLQFGGRWGWYGANDSQAAEAAILGEAGPQGPMFREDGTMWQPLSWAAGLTPGNDYLFILEWLIYNFILLFVIFTALSLILLGYLVMRRQKRHGLGPRVFSVMYIDGRNTKSIGNILCIAALVVAVIGLFLPWYTVSADVSAPSYSSAGSFNALSVDGLNGIQIQLPDQAGPVPLGTVIVPFSLLIGISLVFIVLSTIGISQSKKLGRRYLLRSIRLFIPFILIFVFVLILAPVIPQLAPPALRGNTNVVNIMDAVSASPFNGHSTVSITDAPGGGTASLSWGFGIGMYLILFAGIFLVIAGFLEIAAQARFFEEKEPLMPPVKNMPPIMPHEGEKGGSS